MIEHPLIKVKFAILLGWTAAVIGGLGSVPVWADGMIPETSVVILNEADGETSLSVTNSDSKPAVLLTTLQNVPEDPETLLFVNPPASRVEPGKSQVVRFILQSKTPLKTQRLKRVILEGVPLKNKSSAEATPTAKIGVGVRQNLPVIIHPKGLATNREPWTLLTWSLQGNQLTVRNDSPYVVRLAQEVKLLPAEQTVAMPRTYILAGEQLSMAVQGASTASSATKVRLFPATVYGYAVGHYEATLGAAAKSAP